MNHYLQNQNNVVDLVVVSSSNGQEQLKKAISSKSNSLQPLAANHRHLLNYDNKNEDGFPVERSTMHHIQQSNGTTTSKLPQQFTGTFQQQIPQKETTKNQQQHQLQPSTALISSHDDSIVSQTNQNDKLEQKRGLGQGSSDGELQEIALMSSSMLFVKRPSSSNRRQMRRQGSDHTRLQPNNRNNNEDVGDKDRADEYSTQPASSVTKQNTALLMQQSTSNPLLQQKLVHVTGGGTTDFDTKINTVNSIFNSKMSLQKTTDRQTTNQIIGDQIDQPASSHLLTSSNHLPLASSNVAQNDKDARKKQLLDSSSNSMQVQTTFSHRKHSQNIDPKMHAITNQNQNQDQSNVTWQRQGIGVSGILTTHANSIANFRHGMANESNEGGSSIIIRPSNQEKTIENKEQSNSSPPNRILQFKASSQSPLVGVKNSIQLKNQNSGNNTHQQSSFVKNLYANSSKLLQEREMEETTQNRAGSIANKTQSASNSMLNLASSLFIQRKLLSTNKAIQLTPLDKKQQNNRAVLRRDKGKNASQKAKFVESERQSSKIRSPEKIYKNKNCSKQQINEEYKSLQLIDHQNQQLVEQSSQFSSTQKILNQGFRTSVSPKGGNLKKYVNKNSNNQTLDHSNDHRMSQSLVQYEQDEYSGVVDEDQDLSQIKHEIPNLQSAAKSNLGLLKKFENKSAKANDLSQTNSRNFRIIEGDKKDESAYKGTLPNLAGELSQRQEDFQANLSQKVIPVWHGFNQISIKKKCDLSGLDKAHKTAKNIIKTKNENQSYDTNFKSQSSQSHLRNIINKNKKEVIQKARKQQAKYSLQNDNSQPNYKSKSSNRNHLHNEQNEQLMQGMVNKNLSQKKQPFGLRESESAMTRGNSTVDPNQSLSSNLEAQLGYPIAENLKKIIKKSNGKFEKLGLNKRNDLIEQYAETARENMTSLERSLQNSHSTQTIDPNALFLKKVDQMSILNAEKRRINQANEKIEFCEIRARRQENEDKLTGKALHALLTSYLKGLKSVLVYPQNTKTGYSLDLTNFISEIVQGVDFAFALSQKHADQRVLAEQKKQQDTEIQVEEMRKSIHVLEETLRNRPYQRHFSEDDLKMAIKETLKDEDSEQVSAKISINDTIEGAVYSNAGEKLKDVEQMIDRVQKQDIKKNMRVSLAEPELLQNMSQTINELGQSFETEKKSVISETAKKVLSRFYRHFETSDGSTQTVDNMVESFKNTIASQKEILQKVRDELFDLKQFNEELENQSNSLRMQLVGLQKDLKREQGEVADLKETLEEKDQLVDEIKQESQILRSMKGELQGNLIESAEEIKTLNLQIEELTLQLANTKTLLSELKNENLQSDGEKQSEQEQKDSERDINQNQEIKSINSQKELKSGRSQQEISLENKNNKKHVCKLEPTAIKRLEDKIRKDVRDAMEQEFTEKFETDFRQKEMVLKATLSQRQDRINALQEEVEKSEKEVQNLRRTVTLVQNEKESMMSSMQSNLPLRPSFDKDKIMKSAEKKGKNDSDDQQIVHIETKGNQKGHTSSQDQKSPQKDTLEPAIDFDKEKNMQGEDRTSDKSNIGRQTSRDQKHKRKGNTILNSKDTTNALRKQAKASLNRSNIKGGVVDQDYLDSSPKLKRSSLSPRNNAGNWGDTSTELRSISNNQDRQTAALYGRNSLHQMKFDKEAIQVRGQVAPVGHHPSLRFRSVSPHEKPGEEMMRAAGDHKANQQMLQPKLTSDFIFSGVKSLNLQILKSKGEAEEQKGQQKQKQKQYDGQYGAQDYAEQVERARQREKQLENFDLKEAKFALENSEMKLLSLIMQKKGKFGKDLDSYRLSQQGVGPIPKMVIHKETETQTEPVDVFEKTPLHSIKILQDSNSLSHLDNQAQIDASSYKLSSVPSESVILNSKLPKNKQNLPADSNLYQKKQQNFQDQLGQSLTNQSSKGSFIEMHMLPANKNFVKVGVQSQQAVNQNYCIKCQSDLDHPQNRLMIAQQTSNDRWYEQNQNQFDSSRISIAPKKAPHSLQQPTKTFSTGQDHSQQVCEELIRLAMRRADTKLQNERIFLGNQISQQSNQKKGLPQNSPTNAKHYALYNGTATDSMATQKVQNSSNTNVYSLIQSMVGDEPRNEKIIFPSSSKKQQASPLKQTGIIATNQNQHFNDNLNQSSGLMHNEENANEGGMMNKKLYQQQNNFESLVDFATPVNLSVELVGGSGLGNDHCGDGSSCTNQDLTMVENSARSKSIQNANQQPTPLIQQTPILAPQYFKAVDQQNKATAYRPRLQQQKEQQLLPTAVNSQQISTRQIYQQKHSPTKSSSQYAQMLQQQSQMQQQYVPNHQQKATTTVTTVSGSQTRATRGQGGASLLVNKEANKTTKDKNNLSSQHDGMTRTENEEGESFQQYGGLDGGYGYGHSGYNMNQLADSTAQYSALDFNSTNNQLIKGAKKKNKGIYGGNGMLQAGIIEEGGTGINNIAFHMKSGQSPSTRLQKQHNQWQNGLGQQQSLQQHQKHLEFNIQTRNNFAEDDCMMRTRERDPPMRSPTKQQQPLIESNHSALKINRTSTDEKGFLQGQKPVQLKMENP